MPINIGGSAIKGVYLGDILLTGGDIDLASFCASVCDGINGDDKDTSWALSQGNTGEVLLSLCKIDSDPVIRAQNALKNCTTIKAFVDYSTALATVANSKTAMTAVANSSIAVKMIANYSVAMATITSYSSAMTVIANSSIAMPIFANSSIAMPIFANSNEAMAAIANSRIAITSIASSNVAMTALLKHSNTQFTTGENYNYVDANCLILGVTTDKGTTEIFPAGNTTVSNYQHLMAKNTKGEAHKIIYGLGEDLKEYPEITKQIIANSSFYDLAYYALDNEGR